MNVYILETHQNEEGKNAMPTAAWAGAVHPGITRWRRFLIELLWPL